MVLQAECARDVLGALCRVCKCDDVRLLVHAVSRVADLGPNGVAFLSGVLAVGLPLQTHDHRSYFAWWQLPSVPLTQVSSFV